jgi:hypothetical protein
MNIHIDESGYTGQDLMQPYQPVFVLVSTNLEDGESREIYQDVFSQTRALELKHAQMVRTSRGRRMVVEFVKSIQEMKGRFTSVIVDKEFALLAYLVDLWVEPVMHADGIDLYDKEGNIGLCNVLFMCLRTFQSPDYLRQHLKRFQRMMRDRTPQSYDRFWRPMWQDFHRLDKETADLLVFFLGGEMKLGFPHLQSLGPRSIDLALPIALVTISHWRNQTSEPLHILHDRSSALAKDRELWDIVVSPEIDDTLVGYDRRKVLFPLNVTRTTFVDSKHYLQVQFCDLLAGATAAWASHLAGKAGREQYCEELAEAGIENIMIDQIWPSTSVTPDEMGTSGDNAQNLADFVSELIQKGRKTTG